jgi:hypothetical protein
MASTSARCPTAGFTSAARHDPSADGSLHRPSAACRST